MDPLAFTAKSQNQKRLQVGIKHALLAIRQPSIFISR